MRKNITILMVLCVCGAIFPAFCDVYNDTVSVELVNVYLTATDAHHHFVTDLRPEDLILTENGVVRNIDDFSNFAAIMDNSERWVRLRHFTKRGQPRRILEAHGDRAHI